MKKLFFIYKENNVKIKGLNKNDVIIHLDENMVGKVSERNIEYYSRKIIHQSKQERCGYNIKWIQNWAFKKRNNYKSLAEELIFEGKNFWYPLEFFIHEDSRELNYDASTSRILLYIDCIYDIIKRSRPLKITIENEKSCLNKIIIKICRKEKIKITNLNFEEQERSILNRLINNPLIAKIYIKTRILLRRTIGKLLCKKMKPESVLILTSDRLSNKENITDYYWGPIVKELNRKGIGYKMVEYDRIDSLNSLEQLKKRYLPQKYDAQFIGTYYDSSTIRNMKKMVSFLRKKFRELDKRKDFRESFNYKGIRFYDLIRPRLKKIFLTYSSYIADVYAISKSIIEREKPKIILVDHEKNYYGRALITEAKKKGIMSFAFEGELVYENNTYLTQVPIKEILNEKSPLWKPIPNIKFLWGEHNKQWYIKRNYFPKENIKVVGAPKYDYIKKLDDKNKRKIREKYDVKTGEILVSYFTSISFFEEKFFKEFLKSLRKYKNIKLIIKTHPSFYLSKFYLVKKLLKAYNINSIITRNDCSEIINASELVVAPPSTIIYEAILLRKKILLFGTEEDLQQPYVKERLINPVLNLNKIKEELNKLMKQKDFSKKELYLKFIKKYLYSSDGKSSERAVEEIEKILD